ncbi:MAG: hypothetical protein B7Y43_06925 [Sphingomonas sp. 28-62-20]|uniref:serine hydrolase domain-containing protein n=1 Tax=Sphingomonas sp. 28-62-20 TaxID=1970433 RepID=UPI000BD980B5|nr:MAG: hypothetical protein B7Y43_06925 [Sphingomonas sp. 28-62-20]
MMCDPAWSTRLAVAIAANGVPGASLAIRHKGETAVAVAGVTDMATVAAVTPDTIFRLGSMTKVFTAALVMQQVAAGRIDLDAPVRAVLPELVLADEAAAATVTPRQLLSHRGGFFGDILDGPSEGDDALAAYVAAGKRLEQVTAPGTGFSYCNAGFAIAGRMTEVAGGDIWDRMFVDRLARPLGLMRTGARLDAIPQDDVGTSHGVDARGQPVPLPPDTDGRAMAPAGATAWTTPSDVLAFAAMLMGECPDVLAPASIAAMRALAVAGPTPTFATGWGLGLQRFTRNGETFGHDGAVAGQNSFLRIVAPQDLALVLCCNGGDARGLFADIWAALEADHGMPLADALPDWPTPVPVADPARYAGRYAVPRYAVEVSPHDEGLHARFIPTADAGDFGAPVDVVMRRQPDDPTGELFLTRFGTARLPTQQRFMRLSDGRRMLLFRGRLFPEATV